MYTVYLLHMKHVQIFSQHQQSGNQKVEDVCASDRHRQTNSTDLPCVITTMIYLSRHVADTDTHTRTHRGMGMETTTTTALRQTSKAKENKLA